MNLEERYKRVVNCLVEDMHGELLVFNPRKVVTVHLNEPSAVIWELCDGKSTVNEIIQTLKAAYPSQAGQIAMDVSRVITDLTKNEIIERVRLHG